MTIRLTVTRAVRSVWGMTIEAAQPKASPQTLLQIVLTDPADWPNYVEGAEVEMEIHPVR